MRIRALIVLTVTGVALLTDVAPAQLVEFAGPPVPFEDAGACPFEGCTYREWVAKETVLIRSTRQIEAPIVFRLKPREKVTALTGVVVTIKAGRVEFHQPDDLGSSEGRIHVVPGQTLYLLTYHGEGSTTAWFDGRVYRAVDGSMAFFNSVCDRQPSQCSGKIVERPQTVWWVQIRSAAGRLGWTNEPDKFDGKDRFSG